MVNKVYIGKIVGTHALKGEVKLLSDFNYLNRVLENKVNLYIDDKAYEVISFRPHKNFMLISFKGLNDISLVENLLQKEVFINKEDLNLNDNEYLLDELIGSKVLDGKEEIGIVSDIYLGKYNNFVKVNNRFLIPLNDNYIEKFNREEKILYTINGKSLKIN